MYRERYFKYAGDQRNKYNAKKAEFKGIHYDSNFEAKVAADLEYRRIAGEFKDVERQITVPLDVNGQHICNYRVDFKIIHHDGTIEYVEAKGFMTEVARLKMRLFEVLYCDNNTKFTMVR